MAQEKAPEKRDEPPSEKTQPENSGANETVQFAVVDQSGGEVSFKTKMTTRFARVFETYCAKHGLVRSSVRFLFDGRRIVDDDTPASLKLEHDDRIDAVLEQTGGCLLFFALHFLNKE